MALRQAKALAAWPITTAAKAAPDAASSACPVGKLSPGSPAGGDEGDDERGHLHDGLDGAEHAEDPAQQRTVDEVAPHGRAGQGSGVGRLGAEGQGGQQVGADVEAEDLQHAEGEREPPAGQGPDHERGQLGDVVGEVVGEEAADVGERRPPLLDGGDDGGEVVVEQHEVGGLAGDVGAGAAHGDADVGRLERGAVVHAVAGHGDDVAPGLQGAGDAQLVLGRDAGHDHAVVVEQRAEHLLVGGQIVTSSTTTIGAEETDLGGDGARRRRVVAGDHGDADAGLRGRRRWPPPRWDGAGPRGRPGRAARARSSATSADGVDREPAAGRVATASTRRPRSPSPPAPLPRPPSAQRRRTAVRSRP